VQFTPSAKGNNQITGSYQGDSDHATSFASYNLQVTPKRTTDTTISCSGGSRTSNATCTIYVYDNDAGTITVPKGTVDYSVMKGKTAITTGSCVLVKAGTGESSCSFTFKPTSKGEYSITANYLGNSLHSGSRDRTTYYVGGGDIPKFLSPISLKEFIAPTLKFLNTFRAL
jgi:hypothetical protein